MLVTYEEGKKLCSTHVCGVEGCDGTLVMPWLQDHYEVRCGKCKNALLFTRTLSAAEDARQGVEDPHRLDPDLHAIARQRAAQAVTVVEHLGRTLSDVKDAGSEKPATPDQIRAMIEFADRYSLDVYRNHVALMYGKPYIEIDGLYWLARKTGEWAGMTTRPVTLAEKADVGWEPTDIGWVAECFRKGDNGSYMGWHRIPLSMVEERAKDSSKARYPMLRNWPDRMCEKQAERFALRKAFPDLPCWENEQEGD